MHGGRCAVGGGLGLIRTQEKTRLELKARFA
jgi:hypothetical protein